MMNWTSKEAMQGSRGKRAGEERSKGREARSVGTITNHLVLPDHKIHVGQWKNTLIKEVSREC
jgi:hypothetical protein